MRKNTKERDKAEIIFLDKMLPKVGDDAMKYLADPFGFSLCFGKYGKRAEKNNTYWCADCGAEFSLSEIKDYRIDPEFEKKYKGDKYHYDYLFHHGRSHLGTCPCCGRPMKIDHWRYKRQTLQDVVTTSATFGDWKVTRYFNEVVSCKPGHKAHLVIQDIGACWTRDGRSYEYTARMAGMFYSRWYRSDTRHFVNVFSEPLNEGGITEHYDAPVFSLDDELARRGIDERNLHGFKLTQLLSLMQEDPHVETLWKQGDWEVVKFFKRNLPSMWNEVRIARKHGYMLNGDNLTEWGDMVCMLRSLGKDTHNPKFICPANLQEAHNAVVAEHRRAQEIRIEQARRRQDEENRLAAERELADAKKAEGAFIKRRQKYFGLCIVAEKFKIVCLQTIDEFKDEGNALHHCVFRMGYFRKADSLILSARDADNNPIETLELSLRSFNILQCRGDHDHNSPLHDEIVKVMNDNMWQVKKLSHGKTAVAC